MEHNCSVDEIQCDKYLEGEEGNGAISSFINGFDDTF